MRASHARRQAPVARTCYLCKPVPQDLLNLAERAAQGDQQAVERLLELHLPSVRAYVRAHMGKQLRARESSSDIVQSVCRELLTHQERFRYPSESAFVAWLFTTARRKISNRARDFGRQKRDVDREIASTNNLDLGSLTAAYTRSNSPSQQAIRLEEIAQLEAGLDRLSPEHREVLTLAHLAGLSRSEIATQTGQTEDAVRAMLRRAMARLAIYLEAPDDDAG